MQQNQIMLGISYLFEGLQLILQPRFRHFILVPLAVNVAIFLILTGTLLAYFDGLVSYFVQLFTGWLPEWQWLEPVVKFTASVVWILIALISVVVYGYSFSLITNIIAAPFYGLLAEKIEEHLTGRAPPPESIPSMVGRTLGRELVKLWYFITRGLGILIIAFILGFVPLANFFVPVLLFLWAAWSMSIQYVDYPADNHRLPFTLFRESLGQRRYSAWGLGGVTVLGAMIPLLNILVMPAAVAGGTLFWIRELAEQEQVLRFRESV